MEEQDCKEIKKLVEEEFQSNALPGLQDFIRIPNLSPNFDNNWEENKFLLKAAGHLKDWFCKQNIQNSKIEIIQDEKQAPMVFAEIERTDNTDVRILFYGHFDKQPYGTGWREGLSPTNPVIQNDFLYGRGASDDGYSFFAATLAIKINQIMKQKHPKCFIIIEGEEESGSTYFMKYLDKLKDRLGELDMMICLDSGCGNYDQLWLTTTLRGNIKADLSVSVLNEGVHSGDASGIVPSSFRIIRRLLDRIENSDTGEIINEFQVNVPPNRYEEAYKVSQALNKQLFTQFPFYQNTNPVTNDYLQVYLNRVWRAQLSVVGADGLPQCAIAGNVLLPLTKLRLSLRVPPTSMAKEKANKLKEILETNPPYQSTVNCNIQSALNGWNANELQPWLQNSLQKASMNFFGKEMLCFGEGGSIGLILDLANKFPKIQFVVTGVLGPGANAHGPNECINLSFTKKLICCLVSIVTETSKYLKK